MQQQAQTDLHLRCTVCLNASEEPPALDGFLDPMRPAALSVATTPPRTFPPIGDFRIRKVEAGRIFVEPLGNSPRTSASQIGYAIRSDDRPIPSPEPIWLEVGSEDADLPLPDFCLTATDPTTYVVVPRSEASANGTRTRGRRATGAIASLLCFPLAMTPLNAFASSSAARRRRDLAQDDHAAPKPEHDSDAQPTSNATLPSSSVAPAGPATAPATSPGAAASEVTPDATDDAIEASTSTQPATPARDTSWNALVGTQVVISTSDGATRLGQLIAVDPQTATLQVVDGQVWQLSRAQITSLRSATDATSFTSAPLTTPITSTDAAPRELPAGPPPPSGKGLVITGSILTGAGATLTLVGLGMAAYSLANPWCVTYSYGSSSCVNSAELWALSLALPGLITTGAGVTTLIIGTKRRRQHRRYKAELSFAPTVTRRGWGGGLQLRF